MAVYIDSSVAVRIVAQQPRALTLGELAKLGAPIASVIIEVEVPRAIANLHATGRLGEASAVVAAEDGRAFVRRLHVVELDGTARLRASGPLGAPLRSLDAIHLASALVWRDKNPTDELTFATHDERLARAAQLHSLRVVGWPET